MTKTKKAVIEVIELNELVDEFDEFVEFVEFDDFDDCLFRLCHMSVLMKTVELIRGMKTRMPRC